MIYPWQSDDWNRVQALRANWPHALLFHGLAGTGKVDFARHLANGLLCEAPLTDGQPCGHCAACAWLAQGNHPDFRVVCPEALAAENPGAPGSGGSGEGASDAGDAGGAGGDKDGKKTKTLSKEIKIEQIRSLLDFCSLGSHRGGLRVVLLHPAEALNVAAANALLKTLEEPAPGVCFLLVTQRIDRLLPTVISRCRQWPLTTPDAPSASAWLADQIAQAGTGGADAAKSAAQALAEAGGAPLLALSILRDPEHAALRRFTLTQLAAGVGCDAFACGETLQKAPVPLVLGWIQRWLYDVIALQGAGRARYFPDAGKALERCAGAVDPVALAAFWRTVVSQRAIEQHPLNTRLVFESLFAHYRALFEAE
ncbi:DNA polymerase III subunit delta' [Pararobbsia silviterrae]|uniref:DNA polymerase III subunit delta' n=1 Tax=Pararobbsia silviterrae TaxID=1792498 RepID=A0A494X0E7_9BURK|nr:DNA polymerase III subunit delta' [Pararobbsia silviterrae]RKP44235.1 DNA polymerase III subunit delta' [Pararobbsia silviterrae]